MGLTLQQAKVLWGRSGGRCAKCRRELLKDSADGAWAYPIGEQAHIVGKSENGPRGESPMTSAERETDANYVLLCGGCHIDVDTDRAAWPVGRLQQLKSDHEQWVRQIGEEIPWTEVAGSIEVRVVDAESATGAFVASPARFAPGSRISVDATNVGQVIGLHIDHGPKR